MSEFSLVTIWFAIAALALVGALAGIAVTKRRLADSLPHQFARNLEDSPVTVS